MSVAPTYGGDEVSALVLDPGTSTTRIGYAGEDSPKCVLPTVYGQAEGDAGEDIEMADADGETGANSANGTGGSRKKYYIGDLALHGARPGKELRNPMADGVVDDFEAAVRLWQYGLERELHVDVREHPLLITEAGWNPSKKREKTLEVLLEELQAPAAYLARNGVCSSFSGGKATSLVVDVGAEVTSITPVVDGLVLKKGIQHSRVAGNAVSDAARDHFQAEGIRIRPSYLVSRKVQVEPNAPAQATLRTLSGLTPSYQAFQEDRVIHEWKESCVAILERAYDERIAATRQGRMFEFPDGFNTAFGAERYKIGETIYNPSVSKPSEEQGLAHLLHASISSVDVDSRTQLLNNVLVTGGSSLIPGFTDRLNNELQLIAPGSKVRLYAAGNTAERKFGGWLGGSILASLGTFHQLWISKAEYDENGAGIVEKRCR